jgi:hypothetical protein
MTDRGRNVDRNAPPPSERAAGTPGDPANVAPIAVWLASDDAAECNGRVFGAGGHRISLYHEPIQERVLYGTKPLFEIDWLFDNWDRTLGQDMFFPPPKGMSAARIAPNAPAAKPAG